LDKKVKNIVLNYVDGTEDIIEKGCTVKFEKLENNQAGFDFNFSNLTEEELLSLFVGMFGFMEQEKLLNAVMRLYYHTN